MNLQTVDISNGIMIAVAGDVDMENSPRLRNEIKRSLKSKPSILKVKLADVPYIDSSGIAVLIEGMKWSKSKGADYALVAPSENVRAVLELSKLLPVFSIEDA